MKEVKILEAPKEVLKRIDMICKFACCKYSIKQGSIINIKGNNIAYVGPHFCVYISILTPIFAKSKEVPLNIF